MCYDGKTEGQVMARILIIEDDELIRRMYQQVLNFRGHEVAHAANGEEGLETARVCQPALVLLDIMMPRLNGLETLKRLKTLPGLAATPVIILTNVIGGTTAEAALNTGALKYIIKSDYTPKEVVDMVEGILAGRDRHIA
jgi:CheY-like chemotaxis protein